MRICLFLVAAVVPLLLMATPASGTVEVQVTAIVTEVFDALFNYFDGSIVPGDTITGCFTYLLADPDSDPDSTLGRYGGGEPPWGFDVSVGGYHFQRTNSLSLYVGNDRPAGSTYSGDYVNVFGYAADPGFQGAFIWLWLVDESGAALQSDVPPQPFPDLWQWPDRTTIWIVQDAWEWEIDGDIVELEMVPVAVAPATWGELKARYRNK